MRRAKKMTNNFYEQVLNKYVSVERVKINGENQESEEEDTG